MTREQMQVSDITTTEADAMTLAIARIEDPETPVDEVLATMDKLDFILARAKELKKHGDAAMTARVKEHGSIESGQWLWCLSRDKKIKIRSIRDTAKAVLSATAGDVDSFCQLLSSEPFKQGAIRWLLGEAEHARLYETIIDEYAERKLAKVDKRFIT